MFTFLMILHVFVSMVLILVILMQAGRGGGMSEMFGGSSTQTIFGTSVGKFLAKATAACAIIFIVTSLSLAVLSSRRSRSLMGSGAAQSIVDIAEPISQEAGTPLEEGVPVKDAEELPIPEPE